MGCVEVDTVLMILGVCKRMTPEERDIVTTRMIKGFVGTQQRGLAVAAPVSLPVSAAHALLLPASCGAETCTEAGTSCTGGQTVINPWPIIGGVASS